MAKGTVRLIAFLGCPSSLAAAARHALQKGRDVRFLAVLAPGESSESLRQNWEFAVQPLGESLNLVILHEQPSRAFEAIANFGAELASNLSAELDMLFLSDESSWLGSKRLARELRNLQEKLDIIAPNSLVRRI